MVAVTVLVAALAGTAHAATVRIHPIGNTDLCLTADSNNRFLQPVTLQNCDCSNPWQDWDVNAGRTTISVTGEKERHLCVVGGVNPIRGWFPGDGVPLVTWLCDPNDTQDGYSTFVYHDGVFQTTGNNSGIPPRPANNYCMDNTNGNLSPGNRPQYWTCYPGNTNQQWVTSPQV